MCATVLFSQLNFYGQFNWLWRRYEPYMWEKMQNKCPFSYILAEMIWKSITQLVWDTFARIYLILYWVRRFRYFFLMNDLRNEKIASFQLKFRLKDANQRSKNILTVGLCIADVRPFVLIVFERFKIETISKRTSFT